LSNFDLETRLEQARCFTLLGHDPKGTAILSAAAYSLRGLQADFDGGQPSIQQFLQTQESSKAQDCCSAVTQ